MNEQYELREKVSEEARATLSAYPELLCELLYARGISDPHEAEKFLNPDFDDHSHDPFLLKGMDKATERILHAIAHNERIVVYSDYDADGIPGAVVFSDLLKRIGYKNFTVYIPHRHDEGFGLNVQAIDAIAKDGARLIVTIDCGIADVDEVDHAVSLGLDVIITDHHLPGNTLPRAYAIIDAKQKGCSYPYGELCGSGIAWKLAQAILKTRRFDVKEGHEKWLLDMVGLATLSDMVPLLGENRILAHYGLKVLRKSPRPGLAKLLALAKVNQQHLTEDDVAFMVTPRINAASRMGVPMDAFMLLSADDPVEAGRYAEHLNRVNDERKGIVAAMVKDMKHHVRERLINNDQPVIVMGNPQWRPALLGLAANALVEEYSRPVFLWGGEEGEHLKGSCRSDGSASVVEIMHAAKESFGQFGGHHMSGGFTVVREKVHNLEEALVEAYIQVKEQAHEKQKILIDKKLSIDDVNWETWRMIEKLAPFGMGNPKPLFLFEGVELAGVRQFGKEGGHLELGFINRAGKKICAIGFFMKHEEFDKKIKAGDRINLVATMEKSMFRNFPELRLRIVDVI